MATKTMKTRRVVERREHESAGLSITAKCARCRWIDTNVLPFRNLHALRPVLAYLARIEELGSQLGRLNATLDAESRASVRYIRAYAVESRRLVELHLREAKA